MTTFSTTIDAMYTLNQPDPNYVVNVQWTVTGVDGNNTAFANGNTTFDSSQQSGEFVPYNQLTEAMVIGWIPAEDIAYAQANVQAQIAAMSNPPAMPQNTALPWAQS